MGCLRPLFFDWLPQRSLSKSREKWESPSIFCAENRSFSGIQYKKQVNSACYSRSLCPTHAGMNQALSTLSSSIPPFAPHMWRRTAAMIAGFYRALPRSTLYFLFSPVSAKNAFLFLRQTGKMNTGKKAFRSHAKKGCCRYPGGLQRRAGKSAFGTRSCWQGLVCYTICSARRAKG